MYISIEDRISGTNEVLIINLYSWLLNDTDDKRNNVDYQAVHEWNKDTLESRTPYSYVKFSDYLYI